MSPARELMLSRVLLGAIIIVSTATLWVTISSARDSAQARADRAVQAEQAAAAQAEQARVLLDAVHEVLAEIRAEQARAAASRAGFRRDLDALLEELGVQVEALEDAPRSADRPSAAPQFREQSQREQPPPEQPPPEERPPDPPPPEPPADEDEDVCVGVSVPVTGHCVPAPGRSR
jgi:hypothetical protein